MKTIIFAAIAVLISLPALSGSAQEQRPGQPLYFPKEQVRDRPLDLHLGSDPHYSPDAVQREGTDETGYQPHYDPAQELVEEKTIYRRVDDGAESEPPPSRWQQ